jgi:hypothetical protein
MAYMNWFWACVFVQEGCDEFDISGLKDMNCRRNLVQVTRQCCCPGHVLYPSCYGLTQSGTIAEVHSWNPDMLAVSGIE